MSSTPPGTYPFVLLTLQILGRFLRLAKKWCVDVVRCQLSNMFQTLVDDDHDVMLEVVSGDA